MRYCAFALVAGVAACHCLPSLPPFSICAAGVLLAIALGRYPAGRLPACFILGLLWAIWRADLVLTERLDPAFAGRVVTVQGRLREAPVSFGIGVRMIFDVTDARDLRGHPLPLRRVLLNWFRADEIPAVGAQCDLKARLELPHGTLNPAGFDREKWLFRRRIGATGSVLAHVANTCELSRRSLLGRTRAAIRSQLHDRGASGPAPHVIAALTIADRSAFEDSHWAVLRDTGTAHLVAISGLHISLAAGAAFVLVRFGIGLLAPLARRWPAQRPAAFAAIAAAGTYAALAGFPVSAQRALVMLTIAMLCVAWRRPAVTLDNYAFAMAAIALLDPLVLLGAGFWLSFAAVGCLLLLDRARSAGGTPWRLVRLHVLLALGMSPLLGLLYQSVPLAAPVANLVAVPVVSFALVPLALAGVGLLAVSARYAEMAFAACDGIWSVLWRYLCWLDAHIPSATLPFAPSPVTLSLAVLAVALVFVPLVPAARPLGAVLCTVLLLGREPNLARGDVRVTVLDVGQGLAVVAQTAAHVLVYDTGPALGRYSAGADVIAPFLRSRGIRRVDHLVLSHGDADHSGGWRGLAASLPVARVTTSPRHAMAPPGSRCRADQQWHRDGVTFRFLHPATPAAGSDNDLSCVLQIVAPGGRVLLPGDIERDAETRLVGRAGERLRADIVVAPHHGSATSSSPAFIAAVRPHFAVFSAGFRNRFGFPHPAVVAAYRDSGARTLTTAEHGAITFEIRERIGPPAVYRDVHRRYWHGRTFDPADG